MGKGARAIAEARARAALFTAADTRAADSGAARAGTSVAALMARAGAAVASCVGEHWPDGPINVACGPGNNGGDGYVAATRLRLANRSVSVWETGPPAGAAAREARDRWLALGERTHVLDQNAAAAIGQARGPLVDALFGAGLSRPLSGAAAALAERRRASGGMVLSVDVPSGVDGDTGRVAGTAFRAAVTVAFERARPGHFLAEGGALTGQLRTVAIGVPDTVLHDVASSARIFRNHPCLWSRTVAKENPSEHKYDHGHAAVLGGPAGAGGAARLAARAALRAGAGLVTIWISEEARLENAAALEAVMLRGCDSVGEWRAGIEDPRVRAVLLGPGGGVGRRTRAFVEAALESKNLRCSRRITVLDADALTSFADDPADLFRRVVHGGVVLTPHFGEFSRLFPDLASRMRESAESPADLVLAAARRSGATVLLKGACTIIACPSGLRCIQPLLGADAVPWLATAGSGDVMAGFLAGFGARGLDSWSAAAAAAWIHGEAGRRVGAGLTAEDLADAAAGAITAAAAARGVVGG